jgi:hypothetical protein
MGKELRERGEEIEIQRVKECKRGSKGLFWSVGEGRHKRVKKCRNGSKGLF